jgi:hypothetical protein
MAAASARTVWKGFIQFSLVSVPVRAYTAAAGGGGGGRISLNQLHSACHSRIKYQKVCPLHGEVPADEIVSGYEFAKDQYVVVDPAELDKLRTPKERAVTIEGFIDPADVPIRHYSGTAYYLAPDGPIGHKPYALLHRVMQDTGRVGFAHATGQEAVMTKPEALNLLDATLPAAATFSVLYREHAHRGVAGRRSESRGWRVMVRYVAQGAHYFENSAGEDLATIVQQAVQRFADWEAGQSGHAKPGQLEAPGGAERRNNTSPGRCGGDVA